MREGGEKGEGSRTLPFFSVAFALLARPLVLLMVARDLKVFFAVLTEAPTRSIASSDHP